MLYYYSWTIKQRQKNFTIVRAETEGATQQEIRVWAELNHNHG